MSEIFIGLVWIGILATYPLFKKYIYPHIEWLVEEWID